MITFNEIWLRHSLTRLGSATWCLFGQQDFFHSRLLHIQHLHDVMLWAQEWCTISYRIKNDYIIWLSEILQLMCISRGMYWYPYLFIIDGSFWALRNGGNLQCWNSRPYYIRRDWYINCIFQCFQLFDLFLVLFYSFLW